MESLTQPCGVRLPGREQASALVQVDGAVVVGTQAGQLLLYRLLPSADGDPASPTSECWLEARLRLRPGVQVCGRLLPSSDISLLAQTVPSFIASGNRVASNSSTHSLEATQPNPATILAVSPSAHRSTASRISTAQ